MKMSKIKNIALNLAFAATLIAAGCVSKSYDKGTATSDALESAASAVSQSSARIYDVLGAMNNLTFKSAGDLRDQYDAFVSASKNLDKANDDLDAKVIQLRVASAAFAENWSNQMTTIQNPDLRTRSAARMDEVTAQLKNVEASYDGVKNSFKPFTSDLKDIQTYLGTDLTAGGIANIKDVVSKTKVDAVPLRDSIKQLQASFRNLGTALSPVLPAPEQK
jgi:tetrahydromethanopterin S-methyltransferase subunit B